MARKHQDQRQKPLEKDRNEDPLTGETGSHPVATGVGAALGGLAAGAAAGSLAGPAGTVTGAILGGLAGGLAGKAVGEEIDPTVEESYWREEYPNRDYYDPDLDYDSTYAAAYRHGWESRPKYRGQSFDDAEPTLRSNWESGDFQDQLDWDRARLASRDAWIRVDEIYLIEPTDEPLDDVTYTDDTYVGDDIDSEPTNPYPPKG